MRNTLPGITPGKVLKFLLAMLVFLGLAFPFDRGAVGSETLTDDEIATFSRDAVFGQGEGHENAIGRLVERGNRDVVPALLLALRFRGNPPVVLKAVSSLTGETFEGWHQAAEWIEKHPEIVPHDSFREIKLDMLRFIDPNFLRFLGKERGRRENLDIRLEEIVWGGVRVDGIPSLDDPTLVAGAQADYMLDGDLVFGVEINGDARAYPLRIMGWHEMFNETIGGVPVALAYCTLCGAGILFETQVEDREEPFRFGSSGLLYRSNKLMFDRQTDSLWNQFTGEPVSGPLRGSGIRLKMRPVVITSWADWKDRHPETKVLSIETGHRRDYGSGVVYKEYFASPDLMFPVVVGNQEYARKKDYVFGIRGTAAAKAWPLEAFKEAHVINDAVGGLSVVLIGDAATRTVRAYERGDLEFSPSDTPGRIAGPGGDWRLTEDALIGPDGARLARVAGHVSYWFAWDSYLGVRSELYKE